LFLLLGTQKKKKLPLPPSPNFNYVAEARIHHRHTAANDDDLITKYAGKKE